MYEDRRGGYRSGKKEEGGPGNFVNGVRDYLVLFLSVGSSNEQPRFQICRNAYVIGDNVGGIDLRHDVPAKLKCIRLTFRITNSSCTPTVSPRGIDTSRFYRASILALARFCFARNFCFTHTFVRTYVCVYAHGLRGCGAKKNRNPRKNPSVAFASREKGRRANGERLERSRRALNACARTLDLNG